MKILSKSFVFFLYFVVLSITGFTQENNQKLDQLKMKDGFVKLDDGSLYYTEYGSGTPIIVVHGGPGLDQGYFKPQLLQLAENNRLIFYDQRGSGESLVTKLDEEHLNFETFVADIETLRKSLGLDKFVLLGHSWGGILAMQYAIAHQDHLLALILANSGAGNFKGNELFNKEFEANAKDIPGNIQALSNYEAFSKLNKKELSKIHRDVFTIYFYNHDDAKDISLDMTVESAQGGYKVREIMSKLYLQPDFNIYPKLKELKVPTLIITGKQDINPVSVAQDIHNAIPNSELVVIDKSGHFPYIEQPSQFFGAINEFLKKNSLESQK